MTAKDSNLVSLPVPQGALHGVREDGIAGWAFNPQKPHEPSDVEILVNDALAGTARAELFDAELARQGIGNGSHAFRFRLTELPALPCRFRARLPQAQTDLPGTFAIERLEDLAPALEPAVRFEGGVDEFRVGRIHGWVMDRCRPGARVRVALRDWKEVQHFVLADIYRPGLEASGHGDGRHAFALRLPVTLLDGREHTLRVTVEDQDWELPGGRITLDDAKVRELIEIIAPWRADAARIDSALTKLDELISRVEAERGLSLADRVRRILGG